MSTRPDSGPTVIEVSRPEAAGSAWWKIAAMATFGFAAGVLWPRLLGMRPGPSAPPESLATAQPSEAETASPPTPAVAAVTVAPLVPSAVPAGGATAEAPQAPLAPAVVSVGHGFAIACRSSDGVTTKGAPCGSTAARDALLVPKLRRALQCDASVTASGKLQVIAVLDFERNAVSIESGRGSTVANADAILACAKGGVRTNPAALSAIAHEQSRYTMLYSVSFGGASPSEPTRVGAGATTLADRTSTASPGSTIAAPAAIPAGGGDGPGSAATAKVVFEVGMVRNAPHKDATLLARLPRGTPVRLGTAKDGWYEIHYGSGFSNEGWLYAGALAK